MPRRHLWMDRLLDSKVIVRQRLPLIPASSPLPWKRIQSNRSITIMQRLWLRSHLEWLVVRRQLDRWVSSHRAIASSTMLVKLWIFRRWVRIHRPFKPPSSITSSALLTATTLIPNSHQEKPTQHPSAVNRCRPMRASFASKTLRRPPILVALQHPFKMPSRVERVIASSLAAPTPHIIVPSAVCWTPNRWQRPKPKAKFWQMFKDSGRLLTSLCDKIIVTM